MSDLVNLIEQIRLRDNPANEETTKFTILGPILQAVGWKSHELLYEHPVGGNTGGGRVDIALSLNLPENSQHIAALVEAKNPKANLAQYFDQLLRYAHYEGCDICVLTNGIEWWLFLPLEKGAPINRRFTTLNLRNTPVEQLVEDLETFLSKENLTNGHALQQAKRVLKARRRRAFLEKKTPEIWRSMLNQPDQELIELVVKRVYERIDLRPDEAQVVATLHHTTPPHTIPKTPITTAMLAAVDARPPVTTITPPHNTSNSRAQQPATTPNTTTLTREQPLAPPNDTPQEPAARRTLPRRLRFKPEVIQIFGQTRSAETWKKVFEEVLSEMYRQHPNEYDQTLRQFWGNSVSENPKQIRRAFRPSGAQLYLSVNWTALSICEKIDRILKAFGYSRDDLKIQVRAAEENSSNDETTAQDQTSSHQDIPTFHTQNRWIPLTEIIEILKSLRKPQRPQLSPKTPSTTATPTHAHPTNPPNTTTSPQTPSTTATPTAANAKPPAATVTPPNNTAQQPAANSQAQQPVTDNTTTQTREQPQPHLNPHTGTPKSTHPNLPTNTLNNPYISTTEPKAPPEPSQTSKSEPTPDKNRSSHATTKYRLKPTMVRIFGEYRPVKTWQSAFKEAGQCYTDTTRTNTIKSYATSGGI